MMALSLVESLNKAISYLQAGELEQAEGLFQGILHLQANNIDALHLLGVLKLQQGFADEGLLLLERSATCCLKALAEEPQSVQLNLLLAYIYIDLQQWNNAEQYFRQVLLHNSDLSEAFNGLGSIYFNQGLMQRAYSMFYQAIKKDSHNVAALYNQGIVLRSLGKLNEAESILSQAVQLSPNHVAALGSLGLTLQELNKLAEAKIAYSQALASDPSNAFAEHMLAALNDRTTSHAPQAFVTELFNAYAPGYEQHLQETLEFKAPTLIMQALNEHCAKSLPFTDVLDLGCGTGLMAQELKSRAKNIDGIDLSAKMLMLANSKNLYRSLEVTDINTFLKNTANRYNCCIASDVFIYLGDLSETFASINKVLKEKGIFALSTEIDLDDSYTLLKTGRYAHSKSYIESLAQISHFDLIYYEEVKLRKETDNWINGCIYLLRKK